MLRLDTRTHSHPHTHTHTHTHTHSHTHTHTHTHTHSHTHTHNTGVMTCVFVCSSEAHSQLTVISVKAMLATLCGGKLVDKLRCEFILILTLFLLCSHLHSSL